MSDARAPQLFNFDATDLKKEWSEWYQAFGIYLIAAKKKSEKDDVKIAILLNQLGSRGIEIYNSLKADALIKAEAEPSADETVLSKYEEVAGAFSNYFSPRRNVLHERFKFNRLTLKPGQPLMEFITLLKTAAATCEYAERNNMVRDRIISQISEEDLLNRLLDKESQLSLDETVNICKLHEARKTEIQDIAGGSREEKHVDFVKKEETAGASALPNIVAPPANATTEELRGFFALIVKASRQALQLLNGV